GLDDPDVAAVAVRIARREHVEELRELHIVHQSRLGETTVRQAATLGKRDQLFDIRAKLLRLCRRRRDLLMLDERSRHVPQQGSTVAGSALKLTAANTMAHGSFLSFVRGPCQVTPATQHLGRPRIYPNGNGELSSPPDAKPST